jgi:hypothetical protein
MVLLHHHHDIHKTYISIIIPGFSQYTWMGDCLKQLYHSPLLQLSLGIMSNVVKKISQIDTSIPLQVVFKNGLAGGF